MARKNQLYCRYVRIFPSPDDSNELYIIVRKDTPMSKKYIQKFDNEYMGKDIILSFSKLVRSEVTKKEVEEQKERVAKKAFEDLANNALWSVQI